MTVYMVTNEGNEMDGVCYRAYSLTVADGKLNKTEINLEGVVGWDRLDFFRDALLAAKIIPCESQNSVLNGFFPERGSKKRLCKITDEDFDRLVK